MPRLLAIEDDLLILSCYRAVFKDLGIHLDAAVTAAEGLEHFSQQRPDVVLLDVNLPDLSGIDIYRQLRDLDPKVPTVFVTGSGTTDTAIQAMRLGAHDYLLKPFRLEQLREVVQRALEVSRLMRVPALLAEEPSSDGDSDVLIGRCPAMNEVYKSIGRVAPQDVTVLILGESGTGKELVARAIYNYSRRSAGPFLAINCAAIPETLLESELFGHEKGAFTGANERRIGKFEQCSGGTLFLDEVGDMTPLTQTKILRVLQEQRFERVGGNQSVQTDVRVIAATNRDLEQAVAASQFRQDLYYRLNVYTIRLPPLRERIEDLPLLIDHFLSRFRRELNKEVHRVAPETLALLKRYPWPGNLRELQSILKHALLQATGPVLLPDFLPPQLKTTPSGAPISQPAPVEGANDWDQFVEDRLEAGSQNLYTEWQQLTDRRLFARVLRHTRGNLSQAAKILGIHRATLRAKIEALGLDPDVAAES